LAWVGRDCVIACAVVPLEKMIHDFLFELDRDFIDMGLIYCRYAATINNAQTLRSKVSFGNPSLPSLIERMGIRSFQRIPDKNRLIRFADEK